MDLTYQQEEEVQYVMNYYTGAELRHLFTFLYRRAAPPVTATTKRVIVIKIVKAMQKFRN